MNAVVKKIDTGEPRRFIGRPPLTSPHTVAPLFFGYHKNECHVTTCILVEKDVFNKPIRALAKGVSICSLMDQFSRRRGREIAEGRAYKALRFARKVAPADDRLPFFAIRREDAFNILEISGHDAALCDYKAVVNPTPQDLTAHEQKMLGL